MAIDPTPLASLPASAWISLAVALVASLLFITKWIAMEVTALCIPVVLLVTRALDDPQLALQGFGSPAVIALASILVVAAGLRESGFAKFVARGLEHASGRNPVRLLVFATLLSAGLSSIMPNAAAVAVLLPSVVALCRRAEVPPSLMLIPFSFAVVLGGNVTLIGTASNILVSEQLRLIEGIGFGMFDFAQIGVPLVLVGIIFMAFFGRKLLPNRTTADRFEEAEIPRELAESYAVTQNLYRVKVGPHSGIRGKTIAEAQIGSRYQLSVLMVVRTKKLAHLYMEPRSDLRLQVGDQLYLEGHDLSAITFALEEATQFGLPDEEHLERILDHGVTFAEVTLQPRSEASGRTIKELEFRQRHGLNMLALWRRGVPVREGIADTPLEIGDGFLVSGPSRSIQKLSRNPAYVVISNVPEVEDVSRAPLAALLLLLAVIPPIIGWLPLEVSALAAAVLMVATRCITFERAERALDWRVLLVIIGVLPLGSALGNSGMAAAMANVMLGTVQVLGPAAILATLFLVAAAISMTCSNAASAVILSPIAVQAAESVPQLEPQQALLAVAYGCSCVFVLPIANQSHLMVMGPGGYRSRDFVRLGIGVSVVVMATAIALLARM
ncbi:MAG: SLC13 family permease [Planctomycetota bacterium]